MTALLDRVQALTYAPAGQFCPLCGRAGAHVREKDGVEIRLCCDVLLSWPYPDVETYERQYTSPNLDYHQDAAERLGHPAQYRRFEEHSIAGRARVQWLQQHLPPVPGIVSLLDIGAGNGALVSEARRSGWQALGLEPSEWMCEWAWKNHGVPLIRGSWEDLAGNYTVITATDVLEHLVRPAGFLQRCQRHSRHLYLETPELYADGWERHLKPYEHPVLYSVGALGALLTRCGWKAMSISRPIPSKLAVLCEAGDGT